MELNCLALLTLVIGGLEVFLFSGLIFGWAALEYVLEMDGYFSSYCSNSSNHSSINMSMTFEQNHALTPTDRPDICVEQKEWLNLVFTIATTGTSTLSPLLGYVQDKLGTAWSRAIIICSLTIGLIGTAFISQAKYVFYVDF